MKNTGIEIIDSQHEFIERVINKLIDVLAKREESLYNSSDILQEIIDYYTIHFYTESIFLSKLNITQKRIEDHKNEHEVFLKKLQDFKNEKSPITIELLLSLKDWANNHINDDDFKDFSTFA